MVIPILCQPSKPSIKELEDPIDVARGFRMAFREADSEGVSESFLLGNKKQIQKIVTNLDTAEADILKELEDVTFLTLFGKEVSIQSYTAMVKYILSAGITGISIAGVSISSQFSEDDKTGIIAPMIGAANLALTFFLNKTRTFESRVKNREDKLKLLIHYVNPYKEFFENLLQKIENGSSEDIAAASRRSIGYQANQTPCENFDNIGGITEEDGAQVALRHRKKRSKEEANLSEIDFPQTFATKNI